MEKVLEAGVKAGLSTPILNSSSIIQSHRQERRGDMGPGQERRTSGNIHEEGRLGSEPEQHMGLVGESELLGEAELRHSRREAVGLYSKPVRSS